MNAEKLHTGSHSVLYKYCPTCKRKQHIFEFKRQKSHVLRTCCLDCVNTYSAEELHQLLNPADNGPDILEEKTIYVTSKWYSQPIEIERAQRLVKEGAAIVISPLHIRLLFNNDRALRNHVLSTHEGKCYRCNGTATTAERIMMKKDGGLKTPANMRPVCLPCSRHMRSYKRKANIHYAVPIYWQNREIDDVIENPAKSIREAIYFDDRIQIYCDVSEHPDHTGLFALCLIIIKQGLNGILVLTKMLDSIPSNASLAELKAIEFALHTFIAFDQKKDIATMIYTDINFHAIRNDTSRVGKLAQSIRDLLEDNINIQYLDNDKQKNNFLYKLAHRYARKAVQHNKSHPDDRNDKYTRLAVSVMQ